MGPSFILQWGYTVLMLCIAGIVVYMLVYFKKKMDVRNEAENYIRDTPLLSGMYFQCR
jgi:heme/copper-type cytochrome/quinol oxidase subunit 2